MPRDVSLSESKCWNGGHEWVKQGAHSRWPLHTVLISRNTYTHNMSMVLYLFAVYIVRKEVNRDIELTVYCTTARMIQ